MLDIKIEKLIFGGQALGRHNNKVVLAWNALPGEDVVVYTFEEKKDYVEGITVKILQPSEYRIEPKEDHFLSCSPWQILGFEQENFWKKEIVKECYKKFANIELDNFDIESDETKIFGYRNKAEYSFITTKEGNLSFAVFKRGQKKRIPIDVCLLESNAINQTAKNILLNLQKLNIGSENLKTLIVRSNMKGQSIAALFTVNFNLNFSAVDDNECEGFHVFYSNPLSPASVATELLYSRGDTFLLENINKAMLKYGVESFFQVNVPIFEKVLNDITKFIEPKSDFLDLYSGVGSISLALCRNIRKAILVDNCKEAIELAKENIEINKVKNFEAFCSETENIVHMIEGDKLIMLDPPRAGLHKKVVKKILEVLPKKIIYLSCNPSTQARDVALLGEKYKIVFFKLYNFFPRTPHVESLCVLESK